MNRIKAVSFYRNLNKNLIKNAFFEWKNQKTNFI